MPELPEVETIKRGLARKIIGLKIKKININSAKSFIGNPKLVQGKKVLNIRRIAKMLDVELVGDSSLLFHLKMSGQLVYDNGKRRFVGGHPTEDMRDKMPHKHTRVIFEFSNNSKLYFNDVRKFGWVRVMDNGQLTIDKFFKNLGPEPLEKQFTWQVLKHNLLKHKNMPVKVVLTDQSAISGVGNIYANEACFVAGLDPKTKVSALTDTQFKSLHQGVIKSLETGIAYGGSTKTHFVDSEGNKGYFLDYAYCYGLDKHQCKICSTEIKKIQLAGRGTYYCPKCQK